jgi:tetratricopeptide (TPR) repeat protein
VFIDGRLEVMGESFFDEYRRTLASTEAMEAAVARYGIGWTVFPYAISPELLSRVSRDSRWRLAHVDALAAVFARRDAPGGASAGDAVPPQIPATALRDLPGLGARGREAPLATWLAGLVRPEKFPTEDYQLGLFHLFRGEAEAAAARLSRATAASGGRYYEIYNNLAAAYWRLKRQDDARACYAIVLEDDPLNRFARERMR